MRNILLILVALSLAGCPKMDTRSYTGLSVEKADKRVVTRILLEEPTKSSGKTSEGEKSAAGPALLLALGNVALNTGVAAGNAAIKDYEDKLSGTFSGTAVFNKLNSDKTCYLTIARGLVEDTDNQSTEWSREIKDIIAGELKKEETGKEESKKEETGKEVSKKEETGKEVSKKEEADKEVSKKEEADKEESSETKHMKTFGFSDNPSFYLRLSITREQVNESTVLVKLKPVLLLYPQSIAIKEGRDKIKNLAVAVSIKGSPAVAKEEKSAVNEEPSSTNESTGDESESDTPEATSDPSSFSFDFGQIAVGSYYTETLFPDMEVAQFMSSSIFNGPMIIKVTVADSSTPHWATKIAQTGLSDSKESLQAALEEIIKAITEDDDDDDDDSGDEN